MLVLTKKSAVSHFKEIKLNCDHYLSMKVAKTKVYKTYSVGQVPGLVYILLSRVTNHDAAKRVIPIAHALSGILL